MEIDEVIARLTRRYWPVLLVAILAPIVTVGMLVSRQPKVYTAQARVAVSAEVPKSAAEASGLVSQVAALATSRDLVSRALSTAGVTTRDADAVATNDVAVTGNGTSAVVTIAVTDRDAAASARLAAALADEVNTAFNDSRIGNLPSVIAGVDRQLTDLATRRAPIAAALSRSAAGRTPDPKLPLLQSQLAGVDTLIADLSSDRNRLSEQLAAAGNASVVATPQTPNQPNSNGMVPKVALSGILGLVLGLIISAVAETVRPTVSGAARLGRLLTVPLLGRLDANPAVLHALGRRVRLAARKAAVTQVVVTSASGKPVPEWVVDRLGSVVLQPLQGFGQATVASEMVLSAVAPPNGSHPPALATTEGHPEQPSQTGQIYEVGTLDELSTAGESAPIGVLVLAGGTVNANAVHEIRDLLSASGWPLLGVVAHPRFGRRP
ncbi:MAG: hypothetical protein QOH56_4257 [Pseudonocardiales bacterium]|nr:hypothetical protein [Pseudonocardiales bacterium]